MKIPCKILALAALIVPCLSAHAQEGGATIVGKVTSQETGEVLDFATVTVLPSKLYTLTDSEGSWSVSGVPAGRITVNVQYYGMDQVDTTFTVKSGSRYTLDLALKTTSFRLDNVVVTAQRSDAGKSTASTISRQAMDHMQTGSLSDIASLLPGVSVSNPDLSKAQTFNIRSVGSSSMNSFGTSVMVDGAPISNNANLQVLSPTVSGNVKEKEDWASISSGVDVRSISTDNIESVEVIRGIPSAQYGDIASGAVLVKSKAGKSPMVVRFKTNPNIYQVSAAKGLEMGGKLGALNISGDYAYNRNSLTASYKYYQRANAKALWSYMFKGGSSMNTSLSFTYAKDTQDPNPDLAGSRASAYSNDLGLQFNSNGHIVINKGWMRSINWLVSGSCNDKVSHVQDIASNAMNLYSTAMTDAVYTNVSGLRIYNPDGSEATSFEEGSGITGRVLPYSYFYQYDIFGKEINSYSKINAEIGKAWESVGEKILAGIDFKTDGNLGKGSVYEDATPPYRSMGNTESGYRRRPFYDIPFVNQYGAFLENEFNWRFGQRALNLTAGARYDLVTSGDMTLSAFSPRINASVDIFPWMNLRGGWGLASKAPTTMHLNPNMAYHDVLLYNGMFSELPAEEQLLLAKTTVYDVKNPDLEIAVNHKAEIGLDFKIAGRYTLALTAYSEHMDNGYSFSRDFSCFHLNTFVPYIKVADNPGSTPTIAPGTDSYNIFFETYKPMNTAVSREKGLEYELDLGRFDAIRTSFFVNGAWMRGEYSSNNYTFTNRTPAGTSVHHVAVYSPGLTTNIYEKLNTTMRATHNIPQIGFAVTLTAYVDWYAKDWTEYGDTDMFEKYISWRDGKVYDFDPALKSDPEFSYMFGGITTSYAVERTSPFMLINFNLSKEVGDWMTASFYVNNLFNHRPMYRSKSSGERKELGIPIFFGFEMKITIK